MGDSLTMAPFFLSFPPSLLGAATSERAISPVHLTRLNFLAAHRLCEEEERARVQFNRQFLSQIVSQVTLEF